MEKIKKTFTVNGVHLKKYFKSKDDRDVWIKGMCKNKSDVFSDDELWMPIPDFSTYEASSLGRIRSLNYKRTGYVKLLKPSLGPDGYLQTMLLDDNGKYKSCKVHKFVTLAFFGKKEFGIEVNHIDGIKTHNQIENLEYCTRSQNMLHAYKNGLEIPVRGELNGNSKLSAEQVLDIRRTAKSGGRYYGRKILAEKYGISQAYIKSLVNNSKLWPTALI